MYQVLLFKSRRHLCKGSIVRLNSDISNFDISVSLLILTIQNNLRSRETVNLL